MNTPLLAEENMSNQEKM